MKRQSASKTVILIGGHLNGKTMEIPADLHRVACILPPKPMILFGQPKQDDLPTLDLDRVHYTACTFYIPGTQRRMTYYVLEGMKTDEACREVAKFEEEDNIEIFPIRL